MKDTFAVSILASIAAFAVGCGNPADNTPDALVSEPVKEVPTVETTADGEAAEGQTYVIGGSSKINFLGSKAVGGEQPGGFKKFVGQLNVVDGRLVAAGSRIVIDMDSTWTESGERLTNHLKNEDFFDVPKFPTATFAATKIEGEGKDVKITGNLTLHGVEKSVGFDAQVEVTAEKVSLKAEFDINRFDFGIEFEGQKDNLIRKEVVIALDVVGAPGKADFSGLEN